MKIVLAFGENRVAVIRGDGNASKIDISDINYASFDHDCVMNGMVTDKAEFLKGISELWAKLKLPKNGIILSLDGNVIRTKRINMPPKLNSQKKIEIVKREFSSGEESPENNIYSFSESNIPGVVTGITADRAFISGLVDTLKEIGIKVAGIYGTRVSVAALIPYIDGFKNKSCIVLTSIGNSVSTVLVENGQFTSLSNTRVFSEHGTTSFAAEISRNISQLLQFQAQASKGGENLVSDVYFIGFPEEDYAVCSESVSNFGLAVGNSLPDSRIHSENLSRGFAHIGVFSIPLNRANLYKELTSDSAKAKERDKKLLMLLPVLVLAAIFAIIVSFMSVNNSRLQAKVDDLNAYINDSSNIEAQTEYNDYLAQSSVLNRKYSAAEDIKQAIESYPLATSALNDIIARSGEGIVDVVINSYSADTGRLEFTATGRNADTLNEFIRALTDTGIFYNVTYSGYVLTDDTNYDVIVSCTLSGSAGR